MSIDQQQRNELIKAVENALQNGEQPSPELMREVAACSNQEFGASHGHDQELRKFKAGLEKLGFNEDIFEHGKLDKDEDVTIERSNEGPSLKSSSPFSPFFSMDTERTPTPTNSSQQNRDEKGKGADTSPFSSMSEAPTPFS